MISLECAVDDSGCIRFLRSTGHAAKRGSFSPACALVSGILRSLGRLLCSVPDLGIQGAAAEKGSFELHVSVVASDRKAWYRGVSDFVVCALQDVRGEYPQDVEVFLSIYKEK